MIPCLVMAVLSGFIAWDAWRWDHYGWQLLAVFPVGYVGFAILIWALT